MSGGHLGHRRADFAALLELRDLLGKIGLLLREGIADGLIADGIRPEDAEREASLVKATFTGLVLDLLATGHRKRLTEALECTLSRLDGLTQPVP